MRLPILFLLLMCLTPGCLGGQRRTDRIAKHESKIAESLDSLVQSKTNLNVVISAWGPPDSLSSAAGLTIAQWTRRDLRYTLSFNEQNILTSWKLARL